MNKTTGVHLYVNIKNLIEIIKDEEKTDDDLKRTLHRLQTYFIGHTKLIKEFDGEIEKYTSGRSHILFKLEDDDMKYEKILEAMVACFIFNNEIFSNLSGYSSYTRFNIHAGMDFGEYFEHNIEDEFNELEFTTIGCVANNSAKIQSYAPKDYVYITRRFYEELDKEHRDKFVELTEEEKGAFHNKIRSKSFYKANYKEIFDDEKLADIEMRLVKVKGRVEKESNDFKILDVTFESCKSQLSFEGLSLKGKNKKIEEAGVLCADIRGFTKLFYENDQNLNDLAEIMQEIYLIMGETTSNMKGTKVQYQGDRIIAIYNDFKYEEEDSIIRMLKTAFTLNQRIQELNNRDDVQKKLSGRKIAIGIGCSIGKVIATRLGMNGNKDNIILSESYKTANTCEEIYANLNEIVIGKNLMDVINSKADELEAPNYLALQELFTSISTTGFYISTATMDVFNDLVEQKRELEDSADKLFESYNLSSDEKEASNLSLRPWGCRKI